MAAITWRNVAAPQVSDVLQFSSNQVNKGLGALSGRFANAANKMDADQLSAAMNQIQQLNQVGQAKDAQSNGFIDGLGLTSPNMQMQARKALANQVGLNRDTLRGDEQFDDATLAREDVATTDLLNKARADGNVEEQNNLANLLNFGGGSTQVGLNAENKQKELTAANENFDQNVAKGTIDRNKVLQNNSGISNEIVASLPTQLKSEVSIGQDGQLQFSQNVGQKQKDIINSGVDQLGGYSPVPTFEDMQRSSIAGASPLVGADRLTSGQDQIAGLSQRDSIVVSDMMGKQAYDKYELASAELDRDNVLKQNPAVPLTPILGLGDVEQATQQYLDLARTNDTWGELGTGDYKQVVDASMNAMNLAKRVLGRDVHMESLTAALSIAPQVLEAKADGGNLGDYFGDKVDAQALADLIVAEDSKRFGRYNQQLEAGNAAANQFLKTQYGIEARGGRNQ